MTVSISPKYLSTGVKRGRDDSPLTLIPEVKSHSVTESASPSGAEVGEGTVEAELHLKGQRLMRPFRSNRVQTAQMVLEAGRDGLEEHYLSTFKDATELFVDFRSNAISATHIIPIHSDLGDRLEDCRSCTPLRLSEPAFPTSRARRPKRTTAEDECSSDDWHHATLGTEWEATRAYSSCSPIFSSKSVDQDRHKRRFFGGRISQDSTRQRVHSTTQELTDSFLELFRVISV